MDRTRDRGSKTARAATELVEVPGVKKAGRKEAHVKTEWGNGYEGVGIAGDRDHAYEETRDYGDGCHGSLCVFGLGIA